MKLVGVGGLLMSVAAASAQPSNLPGAGWLTTASIQNIDTTGTANVTLTTYSVQSAPASTASATFTLAQGAQRIFFPGNNGANGTVDVSPSLGAGFTGSLVISADKAVAAVAQVGNNQNGSFGTLGGYASAQYLGTSGASSTIFYPTVKSNFAGKSTLLSVQAAGSNVTYVATITDNAGVAHTRTGSIDANRTTLLSGADFTPPMNASGNCGAGNTSPCVGSVRIVATGGNIAGAIVEYVAGQSPATLAQSTSMFTPADGGATLSCPTFKNLFNGRTTGITVQNLGTTDATVNLSLRTAGAPSANPNTTYTGSQVVPAGTSRTFSPTAGNVGGIPVGNTAAATLTATGGNIVANVNEQNPSGTPVKATTYSCFKSAAATSKVAFPQVKKNFGSVANGTNATTGVAIQNVGNSPVDVNLTYVCTNGQTYTASQAGLAVGAVKNFLNQPTVGDGTLCGVTASAGGPIVGLAQETVDLSASTNKNLDTKNFEGIALP